jgi:hypothetical protein
MSTEHATAVVAQLADANLFEIEAPIAVHYARSSITGSPQLSYRDTERELTFSGDEIRRVDTAVGELATVTLRNLPDALIRTFTLVIPAVRLEMGSEVEFACLGIESTDRSGAFVPPPGPAGVLQTHQVHQLSGVARLVAF